MKGFITIIVALLALGSTAVAADTSQGIFHPDFATLQVRVDGAPMAPPVIMQGSSDRIVISFDELAEDRRYLRAELIHCDAEWRENGLVDSEFLDGINQVDIDDYRYSEATLVHYVNYRLTIPDQHLRPTVSGNYLVKVYDTDNPDETLLQARFSIAENIMRLDGDVSVVTDIDTNDRHQQISLTVDAENENVDDLFSDLKLVITQNNRTDNEVMLTHPMRVSGRKAIFEHLKPLIFKAGNEYRRFETVSTQYPGMGVDHIEFAEPLYHFVLAADQPRAAGRYLYDQTQQGRYFIRESNSTDSDVGSDYVVVHFGLEMPKLRSGDIFIEGDLTGRKFDNSAKMNYNPDSGAYEAALLLKQGSYNYQYVIVPGDASGIEGDFAPTFNEYTAKVFYRPRGTRYDRLVGVTTLYSQHK